MPDIMRYSPKSSFRSMRRELDRIFDDLAPLRLFDDNGGETTDLWTPRTDMSETDTEYIVKVDLPGVTKKDVKVNYEDNRLTISGERRKESKEEKENFYRKERFYGSFMRSYTLPHAIKEDEIEARFTDGVLTIHVPKSEVSKPKEIRIK